MESPTSLLSAPLPRAGIISAWRGSASWVCGFVLPCFCGEMCSFSHTFAPTTSTLTSGCQHVCQRAEQSNGSRWNCSKNHLWVFNQVFSCSLLGLMLLFCAFQLLILIPWIMWKQCGIKKSSTSVLAHLSSWWAASWISATPTSRLLTEPDGLWQGKV